MAFDTREESVEDGAPVEFYQFRVYGVTYYYTSAATDQVVGPVTYKANPMECSEIEDTSELPRNNITITVPQNFEMLAFFDAAPPSDVILLNIFYKHRGDDEMQPAWAGRVTNGTRADEKGQLFCESVYSSMKRSGLRRPYSRLCPHVLYGAACRAQDTAFKITLTLDGVDGIYVSSAILSTYPDNRFAGGLIEWEQSPGRIQKRGIKGSSGGTLVLTHPIPELTALQDINVYPGCKHTLADCDSQFNNAVNFGGFPFVPQQNPMGSTSVF